MPRKKILLTGLAAMSLLASAGCGGNSPTSAAPLATIQPPETQVPTGTTTELFTSNVIYRIDPNIVVSMPDMNADIEVFDQNKPYVPQDVQDYMIQVHTCHLGIDQDSMSALLNNYVFNFPGCPISHLSVTCQNGLIDIKATLTKLGIPIPTELEGTLEPNGQGQIVFHPDTIKSAGIPVKGLMGLIGMDVANLINSAPDRGIEVQGNDMVMYVDRMLPPPEIRGKVMGVTVTPGEIVMDFDDGVHRALPPLPTPAKNFMLMWGGNILINDTLNLNAKFEMIDETPDDPMYYYMPVYRQALQAGFSVDREDGSTVVYLPDVKGTAAPTNIFTPELPIQ